MKCVTFMFLAARGARIENSFKNQGMEKSFFTSY